MLVEIRLRTSPRRLSSSAGVGIVSRVAIAAKVCLDRGIVTRAKHLDGLRVDGWLVSRPTVIDLHCHILPGIDDGALDLADSLAMARVAADDGIETISATPHIRHDHDVRIAELPARVAELNGELSRNGVPVEIVTGGEVAETAIEGLGEDELE